jgi:Uma2 family endonuclease
MTPETAFRSDERFTQSDFRRWLRSRPSTDINHYELIDGRIVMTPPAGWPHGHVEARLVRRIEEHVDQKNLGVVQGSSAGYDLPSGDTLEPDVSFILRARFAAGPSPKAGQFLRIVPDLVIEILSPATSRRDRTEKKAVYERNGVREYWIVDPKKRAVSVLHLQKSKYGPARTIQSGVVKSRVLPGLEVPVEEIFGA